MAVMARLLFTLFFIMLSEIMTGLNCEEHGMTIATAKNESGVQFQILDSYLKDIYSHIGRQKSRPHQRRAEDEQLAINNSAGKINRVNFASFNTLKRPNEMGESARQYAPIYYPQMNSYREVFRWNGDKLKRDEPSWNSLGHPSSEKSESKKRKWKKVHEPLTIIHLPLHPEERPSVSFTVNSTSKLFMLEVAPEAKPPVGKYFINVVVERMHCNKSISDAKLVISEDDGDTLFCRGIDNSKNHFQSISGVITDGEQHVNVSGSGNWTTYNFSVELVASIYYETSSCLYCESNEHFCCGSKEQSCDIPVPKSKLFPPRPVLGQHHPYSKNWERVRCIPKEDSLGISALCDKHPNCGFSCNRDELKEFCNGDGPPNGDDHYCSEEHHNGFLVKALLLSIFCVFLPFCAVLLLCIRKDSFREFRRRENGRCPLPLEIAFCPFSMSADSTPEGNQAAATSADRSGRTNRNTSHGGRRQREQRRNRGDGRSGIRRSEEVNSSVSVQSGMDNFSFFDDLPPSYSEYCSNKEMYPNPPKSTQQVPGNKRCALFSVTASPSSMTLPESRSVPQLAEMPPRNVTITTISTGTRCADVGGGDAAAARVTLAGEDAGRQHVCQCDRHRTNSDTVGDGDR